MFKTAGLLLLTLLPASADAATYLFSFTGQVSALGAADRSLMPTALTESEVKIGDAVSASITFTTRRSAVDHDSIFFPGGRDFRLTLGSYSWASPAGAEVFNRLVLHDTPDHDYFDLASLMYGTAPFAGWTGDPAIIFSYYLFDYTAKMLSSGDILDLPALGILPTGGAASVSFNSLGSSTGRIVSASIGNMEARLVAIDAAVPEPAAWMMMVLGFGGSGYVMRRRPSVRMRAVQ